MATPRPLSLVLSALAVALSITGSVFLSISPAQSQHHPQALRTITAAYQAPAAPAAPAYAATSLDISSAKAISAQSYAAHMVWSGGYRCVNYIFTRESGWRTNARNPNSGAYGIPQALPGSKMASAGPDWETDADTQVRWGIDYMRSRWGGPCRAMHHEEAYGWY